MQFVHQEDNETNLSSHLEVPPPFHTPIGTQSDLYEDSASVQASWTHPPPYDLICVQSPPSYNELFPSHFPTPGVCIDVPATSNRTLVRGWTKCTGYTEMKCLTVVVISMIGVSFALLYVFLCPKWEKCPMPTNNNKKIINIWHLWPSLILKFHPWTVQL